MKKHWNTPKIDELNLRDTAHGDPRSYDDDGLYLGMPEGTSWGEKPEDCSACS